MQKKILTEQFIITGEINKLSLIDNNLLKKHISKFDKPFLDDEYSYLSQYTRIEYHNHISWLQEYLRDYFLTNGYGHSLDALYGDLQDFRFSSLKIPKNQTIFTHNHINNNNNLNSPNVSCLYCVDGECEVYFSYDNVNVKDNFWKIPLKPKSYVMFSSSLNHRIKNFNKKTINISLQFLAKT